MPDGTELPAFDMQVLRREADYLHRALFGREPMAMTVEHYVRAHSTLSALAQASVAEQSLVQSVLDRRLDALGVEPWLRGRGRRHLLTAKLLLLTYLGECDGNHPEFARSGTSIRSPWRAFLNTSLYASYRLMRGYLQLLRYGLL